MPLASRRWISWQFENPVACHLTLGHLSKSYTGELVNKAVREVASRNECFLLSPMHNLAAGKSLAWARTHNLDLSTYGAGMLMQY